MSRNDRTFGQQGDMPDFNDLTVNNPNYATLYREALAYARFEFNNAELKQQMERWCELNDHDWDWYKTAADWKFLTVGKIAWVTNNGGELSKETQAWFNKEIVKIRKAVDSAPFEEDLTEELTAKQRATIQYVNLYSRIDQIWYNNRKTPDVIQEQVDKLLRNYNPSINMLKKLYKHYHEEYMLAVKSIKEPSIHDTVMPLMIVNNLLAARTGNASAVINSKKIRTAKTQKKANAVKSKSIDMEWGLVGVDPALVVGARGAIAFNAKTRVLWIYNAASEQGLDLSTSNIVGYDETQSWGKTIRKPKEMLTETNMSSAKRAGIVFGEYVKGKRHEPTGRLNKDTVLIKVF